MQKISVGGTVIFSDADECARYATITLVGNGTKITAETDFLGDFEFEKLEKNRDYVIKIEAKGYQPQEKKIKTKADIYMGIFQMKKV